MPPVGDDSSGHLPITLSPVPRVYVLISAVMAIVVPAIFWLVASAQRKPLSVQILAVPVAFALMMLYVRNMTVRFTDTGISKGLPLLGTLIPYERVAEVRKQTLLQRGSPTAFVISERDSHRQIVIPLFSLDRAELAQMMGLLSRWAPQAHVDELSTYVQLSRR
jgi:hypothetical protein